MARFIVNNNQQSNGDHEVHNASKGCSYMPSLLNQIALGEHSGCHSAVTEAKRRYPSWKVNGCYYCCNSCNTG